MCCITKKWKLYNPLLVEYDVCVKKSILYTVKEIRKLKSQDSRTSECLRFTGPNRISLVRQKNLKTAAPYWIIMKSKTPEKFEKLFRMIIDNCFPDDFMRDTHTIPVETDYVFYAWYCLSTTRKIHFTRQRF